VGESTTNPEHQSTVILELSLAIMIALVSGYIVVMMPALVHGGGIQEAQDFLRLSPVFFPRLSFGLTGLISIVLVFRIMKTLPGRQALMPTFDREKFLGVLIMSALVVLYGLMLPFLGYGFATLLAIGATTYFLGMRSWPQLLAFSFVAPIVTRLIFERLLAISLPLSPYEPLAAFEQNVMSFLSGLFTLGQ
jgi:hypothetical protein